MILQHCPLQYRNKKYGCGYGPIHPTAAFLDYWGKCPNCGNKFKPYRKSITSMLLANSTLSLQCKVTDMNGEYYCDGKAYKGNYCKRHEYVTFSPSNPIIGADGTERRK